MSQPSPPAVLETDPRFPSGPWTGFYLQRAQPGRNMMEMRLTFSQGVIAGVGRDVVGPFAVRGRYDLADGRCHWSKQYVGKHSVHYRGYNEGKGIWGVWTLHEGQAYDDRGGFHIWPEGVAGADPTVLSAAAEFDEPVEVGATRVSARR